MNPLEDQSPKERGRDSQTPIEIEIDENTTLRQVTFVDAERLFEVIDRNRDHLSQFGDETALHYPTLESYQLRLATQNPDEWRFGIWDQDQALGFIKLTKRAEKAAEIGYWLGAEYTGRGYMRKSAKALTRFARESLGFDDIMAKVVKENVASLQVLQNVGYEIVGDDPDDSTQYILRHRQRDEQTV